MAAIPDENPRLDLSSWPSASAFLFYRHAHKLIGAPDPKKFGFKDDNDATFSFQGGYSRKHAYLSLPPNDGPHNGASAQQEWTMWRPD